MKLFLPHLNVFCPWWFECSTCSTVSAPLPVRCTIPVFHVFPYFYAVSGFCVLIPLLQVVQWEILLNSNCPSIAVCDDIFEFRWQGLSIFKVIVACGMS